MGEHWEVIHGNSTVVSLSPEQMWERGIKYFQWCKDNPIARPMTIPVGKYAGGSYDQKSVRPYTVDALCLHLGVTKEYLKSIGRTKDQDSIYYLVVERLLTIIRNQNIEYAMVGDFNSIFVSKVLGLGDEETPTTKITVEVVSSGPPLAESEADIIKKLDAGLDGPELGEDDIPTEQS